MKREDLRKVVIIKETMMTVRKSVTDENYGKVTKSEEKAYFHKWFDKVHDDGTTSQYALLESEDGIVKLYDVNLGISSDDKVLFKFID